MQFELKMGTQEQTQVVQLTHQEGPWIFDDRGQRFRYDGLGLFDSRRYLIKRPLVVGSQWMSVHNRGCGAVFNRWRCPPLRCSSRQHQRLSGGGSTAKYR